MLQQEAVKGQKRTDTSRLGASSKLVAQRLKWVKANEIRLDAISKDALAWRAVQQFRRVDETLQRSSSRRLLFVKFVWKRGHVLAIVKAESKTGAYVAFVRGETWFSCLVAVGLRILTSTMAWRPDS